MKKRILPVISVLFIIILVGVFLYFRLAHTGENATVIRKDVVNGENIMLIRNESNRETSIIVPNVAWGLIRQDKKYFIEYEYNKWRKPFLTYIQEVPEK
ncbi:hypothetical protein ABEX47_30335 [Paenibacillus ehimensis]|uniref:hypothetical protein n=1 Tax=Paenibacillus ehimensis TaxID=79264 RepID=UPI002DBB5873|nr:hypothetical protein [Paenibacillus ehimensis]MEC0211323.1 hypothetical protein [Paenibacillus ehimensis]